MTGRFRSISNTFRWTDNQKCNSQAFLLSNSGTTILKMNVIVTNNRKILVCNQFFLSIYISSFIQFVACTTLDFSIVNTSHKAFCNYIKNQSGNNLVMNAVTVTSNHLI